MSIQLVLKPSDIFQEKALEAYKEQAIHCEEIIDDYSKNNLQVPSSLLKKTVRSHVKSKNYKRAAALYEEVMSSYQSKPVPLHILENAVYINFKAHNFKKAAQIYEKIDWIYARYQAFPPKQIMILGARANAVENNDFRAKEIFAEVIESFEATKSELSSPIVRANL